MDHAEPRPKVLTVVVDVRNSNCFDVTSSNLKTVSCDDRPRYWVDIGSNCACLALAWCRFWEVPGKLPKWRNKQLNNPCTPKATPRSKLYKRQSHDSSESLRRVWNFERHPLNGKVIFHRDKGKAIDVNICDWFVPTKALYVKYWDILCFCYGIDATTNSRIRPLPREANKVLRNGFLVVVMWYTS